MKGLIKKTGQFLKRLELKDVLKEISEIEYTTINTNKKVEYLNLEVAFDIEATSTYINLDEKFAFMYLWTIGFKDSNYIYHGRTWGEFQELIQSLNKLFNLSPSRRLVIYVHNLGYEFQFMRKYFDWEEVFSIELRKPIKAVTTSGIEFRCSYILSGFSLERLAKNLVSHKVEKLIGNLDYSLIRHSETDLTIQEIDYAINDVLIVLYYINEQINYYKDISKIPNTNTGRVRRFVRDRCYYSDKNHKKASKGKYFRYRKLMEDLTLDPMTYKMLTRAFMGGFTHANANYTGKVLEDVTSIDFNSSYPAVMLSEQFPMSRAIPTKLTKEKNFEYYRKRFCLLFDVKFTGLIAKIPQENYISESKCWKLEGALINNGRVQKADILATTITEVDFEIIEQCYEWEKMEIANLHRYYKGYLPYAIIQSIIKLYEDKTVLKGVEGSEVEYLLSKGMLNSVYGMCVTAVVRDEIAYTDDWEINPADIEKQIQDYNESKNRFLYYPWGIWTTAFARRNLWYGIIAMGNDYVYSDTDSIKFLNYEKHKPFIEAYNKNLIKKLKKMCSLYKIPIEKLKPKTKEGKEKFIGLWDFDGHYSKFKTLGSKRYLVEHSKTGELELTVAGLSKKEGLEYMKQVCNNDHEKVFAMFDDELYIPADKTGKNTHTYIDSEMECMILDYRGKEGKAEARSGIHLEKAEFTLSLAREYVNFLNMLKAGYLYKGQKYI